MLCLLYLHCKLGPVEGRDLSTTVFWNVLAKNTSEYLGFEFISNFSSVIRNLNFHLHFYD